MRASIVALLICGCASRSREAPAPGATTVASTLPSNAAPQRTDTPEGAKHAQPVVPPPASPAPAGPMTASEAAAAVSSQHDHGDGRAASEDSPCAKDDDCALTA